MYMFTPYFVFYRLVADWWPTGGRALCRNRIAHQMCMMCLHRATCRNLSGVLLFCPGFWEYGKYFDNIPCLFRVYRDRTE